MSLEAGAGFDAGVESLRVVVSESGFSVGEGAPRLRQVVDEHFAQLGPGGGETLRVYHRRPDSVTGACEGRGKREEGRVPVNVSYSVFAAYGTTNILSGVYRTI